MAARIKSEVIYELVAACDSPADSGGQRPVQKGEEATVRATARDRADGASRLHQGQAGRAGERQQPQRLFGEKRC